jgi:Protein of unknown function (DUF4232)
MDRVSGVRVLQRRAVAPLVGLLALLCALAVPVAAGSARTPPPRCKTGGLVVWLNPEGSGTAGSFYYKLEFVNLSGSTCTLAGYPGVSAVSLSGRQIGASAKREATGRPRPVTLAPEGEATALVHVVDVGALPSSCRPMAAAGFRVYPPGESASKVVPYPFRTCANAHETVMRVRALKRE